jgi:pyruvate/2-oxoglutarate dehydrogenase complex dihydrolipoamide acyltransferase (E2) component
MPPVSSSTTELETIDVLMPQMGTSVSEGTVIAWSKQVGDRVECDETICEISTDKVDTDCPAPTAGVVTELLVEVGATVETGTVIARIAPADSAAPVSGATKPAPTGARLEDGRRRYTPVVRRMAAVHDIDLTAVPGSGRNGRVTKRDVEAFLARAGDSTPLHSDSPYRPESVPTPQAGADTVAGAPAELSRMRRSIGAAMRRSLDTAATCTTIVECDMTRVEQRRRAAGITALPIVARHAIAVLRDFPDLNATLEQTVLTRHVGVNLGVAVSLGDDGLIVPVLKNAQELSEEGLATRIRELASNAREGRLAPDEVRDGTFTITSPGAFGALMATPIINIPEVAILDLETILRRPVVLVDDDGNEGIAIRSMAYLCLSWDHRAIDGAYAARFLTALRERIETDG